jgi:competence protein ComEC
VDNFGFILVLLSILGVFVGLIGVLKGSIKFLKIYSRKKAALFILSCFVIFIVGGAMLDAGMEESPVAQTESFSQNGNIVEVNNEGEPEDNLSTQETSESVIASTNLPEEQSAISGNLEVHFIDVGQADCILVKAPGGNMLIDAGNNADSNLVTSYIKKQGIEKLHVAVGTHPHEDHIGGLDAVINDFDIGKIYMPKVSHTTKTFEDVLLAIQDKGLKISSPTPGATFDLGQAQFTILAPNSSSYDDLNNYSVVLKMQYGNTSFLFTGDAEDVSEREMLNKGFGLTADVLKIGHHGSDSSTTSSFLKVVSPKFAVVMVGTDNSYGHPHQETMNRLKTNNIQVYRTDENGTIIATSDGKDISFNTKPGSYSGGSSSSSGTASGTTSSSESSSVTAPTATSPDSTNDDRIVYWTPNGKSYHYTDKCSTLSRSKKILNGPLSQCPKSDPCDKCVH